MPSSGPTQSRLVRTLIDVGHILTKPAPLQDRINDLCRAATELLDSDSVSVMRIAGDHYISVGQYGLPEHVAHFWPNYRVPRSKPFIGKIEACTSYLLFNRATTDESLARVASLVGVAGLIFVPFTYPDGTPFGHLIASYEDEKQHITSQEAELATGLAGLAQQTLLRDVETQRRREVSRAMLEVADSERRRLSRDIHDDPLQRILSIRIGLEGFRGQLTDAKQREMIDDFVSQCRTASSSLREVMLRTHPNASDLADLEDVLRSMVARNRNETPLQLHFEDNRSQGSPSYLVPALNRVAEQAARNTLRHAAATNLHVHLADQDGGTILKITDDGRGFDPLNVDNTRLGLVSMRERTELLDGVFRIDSPPESGTVISAWFPHADPDDLQD